MYDESKPLGDYCYLVFYMLLFVMLYIMLSSIICTSHTHRLLCDSTISHLDVYITNINSN